MPNYTMNELRADPVVLHTLLTEAGVDFNRMIPQPNNILNGPCGHGINRETLEKACPPNCWYVWNIAHWGTKWNAMRTEMPARDVLRFETANGHPGLVIGSLASRFPHEVIRVRYADEDLGHWLGKYEIQGDVILATPIRQGTKKARQLARKIWKDPAA